jgi:hypothetical protein
MSCITHFRTELRSKVDAVDAELNLLESRMAHGEASSEQLVRAHLEHLSRQLTVKRPFRSVAAAVLKLGHETATAADDDERSRGVDVQDLTHAYNRAWATMDIAVAAIDEAAHAALQAWLAEEHAARAGTAQSGTRAEPKHDK